MIISNMLAFNCMYSVTVASSSIFTVPLFISFKLSSSKQEITNQTPPKMTSKLSADEILKQSKLPDAPPKCTWALDKSKCGPCPHRIMPKRFGLALIFAFGEVSIFFV